MKKEPLDKDLYEILACPICKNNVEYTSDYLALICKKCNKKYEIKNGIPIMLV